MGRAARSMDNRWYNVGTDIVEGSPRLRRGVVAEPTGFTLLVGAAAAAMLFHPSVHRAYWRSHMRRRRMCVASSVSRWRVARLIQSAGAWINRVSSAFNA